MTQIFKGKEIQRVLKILLPPFHVVCIPHVSYPRAMDAGELERIIRGQGAGGSVQVFDSVKETLAFALRQKSSTFIIVTGSFYLAADALKKLGTGSYF